MLSVFQPARCVSTVPVQYMPDRTAYRQRPFLQTAFDVSVNLTPLFQEARLPICPIHSHGCLLREDGRILLFSPGYTIPRLYYNVLASAIASEGFTVITIDHPGDANIITFPDGHAVNGNDTAQSTLAIKQHLAIRVADVSFVIDQLGNTTAMARLLPERGIRSLPIDRVAVLGHSLGGATAVIAAAQDERVRADSTWPATQPLLKGPKLWIVVANTTHETFSDVPTLFQTAGLNATALAGLLGTIAPAELVRIVTTYTAAWMDVAFMDKRQPLLEGKELGKFPEVSIVRKGNL
nr:putative 1-alkyl-2-acetylglycerophosphocholine esterase [Quercus suber]